MDERADYGDRVEVEAWRMASLPRRSIVVRVAASEVALIAAVVLAATSALLAGLIARGAISAWAAPFAASLALLEVVALPRALHMGLVAGVALDNHDWIESRRRAREADEKDGE